MRVKHYSGTVVDVSEGKAAKLASSGSWTYVDEPPQKAVERLEEAPKGEDTLDAPKLPETPSEPQEEVKPAPTIPEMRAWALKNEIEGVREKGKLPRHAIEAYQKAHEEE